MKGILNYKKAFSKLTVEELRHLNKYYGNLSDMYEAVQHQIHHLLQAHDNRKEFLDSLDFFIKQGYIYKINGKKVNIEYYKKLDLSKFNYKARFNDLINRPYITNYRSRQNQGDIYLFKSREEAEKMQAVYINLKGVK
jgi:virulence-associated protein VapD